MRSNSEATAQHTMLTIQLRPAGEPNPLIAQMLPPQLSQVEEMPVPPSDCPPGTMTFEYSHERIAEAFDRYSLPSTHVTHNTANIYVVCYHTMPWAGKAHRKALLCHRLFFRDGGFVA